MPDSGRRWIDPDEEPAEEFVHVEYDPARATVALLRAAGLSILLLAVAAAAAVWSVLVYSGRGPGDTVVHHTISQGPGAESTPTSSYTIQFLLRADLPIVLSALLCAAPFIWWHVTVDRAARECGDGLDSPEWVPVAGWFIPVFNLKMPVVSMRELAEVHGARLAVPAVVGWWGFAALGVGIEGILLNAQHHSKDLDAIDRTGMAAGSSLALAAVLGMVVVASLTVATRARLSLPPEGDSA